MPLVIQQVEYMLYRRHRNHMVDVRSDGNHSSRFFHCLSAKKPSTIWIIIMNVAPRRRAMLRVNNNKIDRQCLLCVQSHTYRNSIQQIARISLYFLLLLLLLCISKIFNFCKKKNLDMCHFGCRSTVAIACKKCHFFSQGIFVSIRKL